MLSDDQLTEIELLAYRYMLKSEIATIMFHSSCDLLFKQQSAINAFEKGRLKRKAEYNGKIIELSNQLSSPAMNIEAKIAEDTFLRDKLQK